MAEEHTGGHGETAGEYIQHHLTNLQVCRVNDAWAWNSAERPGVCKGNFWTVNVDSMAFSIVLGVVFCYSVPQESRRASRQGRPGKLQAGDEWSSTFVDRLGARHVPRQDEQVGRAARADDFGLDLPDEHSWT